MRSVVSRLARLERLNRLSTGPKRLRIQYGYLKTLPDDYRGPRHTVTVRQLPPVEPGQDWFEWEERAGPEPVADRDTRTFAPKNKRHLSRAAEVNAPPAQVLTV